MTDYRLVGTNPEDSSLVPVAVTSAGLLKTSIGKIESIPNDVEVDGNLTVTGDYIGLPEVEGLPTPLGEEGMVLSIMDGKPTWVFFEPPEPPPPEYDLTLVDQRGTTVYNNATYSVHDDGGVAVEPPDDWNTYIRTLSTWETQRDGAYGLALVRTGNPTMPTFTMPFSLDLKGGFGKVIQLTVRMKFEQMTGDWGSAVIKGFVDSENLQAVVTRSEVNRQSGWMEGKLQWLVTRDDIGRCNFTLQCEVVNYSIHTVEIVSLQRFEYIDAYRVLQQMLLAQQALGPAEPT